MKLLTRTEEIILLTILKLGDNAYGVSIREQIFRDTGNLWSFASIYQPLDKLARMAYVTKQKGEPSAERGGKSKFFYKVTSTGKAALRSLRDTHDRIWDGISDIILESRK